MQNIIIRPIKQDDIEKILNNYTEQGWEKPREVIERYVRRQEEKSLFSFIAEYNNDIAGYTILYPFVEKGAFANKNIPEISDFVVFQKYQRNGIGNKILDAAEKKAKELNDFVSLAVGIHSGYGAAQRIYIKRGYVPDGSGAWYNDVQLEQYAPCQNDDDLVLYLLKELQ
ncbi:GNAT family N-acetyltransferase [Anaerosporobacter sp.]|uniref:GNAT family N-acetyltransferase n=1 Tax=Anaerosporobacter sp. TaxID=1872529 RepID=UPI00286F0A3A|nr:GNAT family N-acetyltransferase [Anaerosporobacter sp.]